MRFDVNRLSTLAGIQSGQRKSLHEASNRSKHEESALSDDVLYYHGKGQLSEDKYEEGDHSDVEEGDDEILEIEEEDLVMELRRLKRLQESKRRRSIQEAQLKSIIDKEVKSVLSEMEGLNISGDWVYGKDKPRKSRRGYVATSFPGIGFK